MEYNKKIKLNKVTKVDRIREITNLALKEAKDKVAFMYKNENNVIEVTYAEFMDEVNSFGSSLVGLGVENTHVAIISENRYEWIVSYITVLQSNNVFVPIDKELPEENIINVLENSDSEVLIYSGKYAKYIESIKAKLPNIKYFIGIDEENDKSDKEKSFEGLVKNGQKLLDKGFIKYTNIVTDPYSLKLLVYTSGTTGNAKGVMLSEHNLVSCVYYGLQVSTVYDRCLSVLPYHHTYEAVAGLLVSIHHHSTICINDNLKSVLKNLQLYKPDYIYLVPAFVEIFYKKIQTTIQQKGKEKLFNFMMKLSNNLRKVKIDIRKILFKSVHDAFGGNMKKIVTGGAPLIPELGEFFEAIGISLVNGYGITECSPLVSANMDDFNDSKTVGVVLPCCDIEIANKDEDGIGEILVKGDIVMMGYYKNTKLTEEVLQDGWFNTGDYGTLDEYGRLTITGRKKNLIVLRNGKNVFPEEIECYIMKLPYIQEVVVRGIKDKNGCETGLLAEIFLNEEKIKELDITETGPILENKIKKDILAKTIELPIYKKIEKVKIRSKEFDKTTTNKIKR